MSQSRPQRIGLNLLYLLPGESGGVETYARELVPELAKLSPERDFFIFLNRESRHWQLPKASNIKPVFCALNAKRRALRYGYEQVLLPQKIKKYKLDILHSLNNVGPTQLDIPHIATIHDMNSVAIASSMSNIRRLALGWFVRRTAATSASLITISAFSKQEIVTHLQADDEKISVVHEAASSTLKRALSGILPALPSQLSATPYILTLSSLSPHKNIPRLIRAYANICQQHPHNLVIAGWLPETNTITTLVEELGIKERVHFTGFVDDPMLARLFKDATLFTFPSLYEGFGLPALDAQMAGTALLCSTQGALPEIAGDGAAYFDPNSEEEISHVLDEHLSQASLRDQLVKKGYANVAKFSWEKAARETLMTYDHLSSTETGPAKRRK